MTTALSSPARPVAAGSAEAVASPWAVRTLFLVVVAAAGVGGFLLTRSADSARVVAEAGDDLTRLLRGMALLKTLFAAAVVAGVVYRLGAAISPQRYAVYVVSCAAMAAGPGLIWNMELLRTGALLLHGGLLVALVVLWRDPATALRLHAAVATRRARLR